LVDNIGLAVGIPLVSMPAVHVAACLLMYLATWAVVFLRFPGGTWTKVLAVLATVLPPLGNEIWMNLTNVQWPMALLVFMLVAGPGPRTLIGKVLTMILLMLAALTGPNALLLLPVLLVLHWRTKRPWRWSALWALAIVAAGAVLTVIALVQHGNVE